MLRELIGLEEECKEEAEKCRALHINMVTDHQAPEEQSRNYKTFTYCIDFFIMTFIVFHVSPSSSSFPDDRPELRHKSADPTTTQAPFEQIKTNFFEVLRSFLPIKPGIICRRSGKGTGKADLRS
jgi:hypothetical protein